ncbi:hypothetical protein UPYG_G00036550 [Umbra pygmaea]|uniref:Claudin n=1 Tax=Umbra pygmaea TaxID=75934 RepID=A0ABD0XP08_UMBPY
MTSSGVQLLGYTLALIGAVGSVIAITMVEWKRVFYLDNTTSKETYVGLWAKCTVDATKTTTCDYKSMFQLSSDILTTRVVLIISILLSAIGVLVATLGLRCTHCLEPDFQGKSRVALAGGVLIVIAGLLSISVTSWFANTVVMSFENSNSPITSHNRYEFGSAVLVSWGAAVCSLVGGCLLGCRNPRSFQQTSGSRTFAYPTVVPGNKPGTDYV